MSRCEEFSKFIECVFSEYETPNPAVLQKWVIAFSNYEMDILRAAYKHFLSSTVYGKPTTHQFAQSVKVVMELRYTPSVSCSAASAYVTNDKSLIACDAKSYADRVVPATYKERQFRTPEALGEAEAYYERAHYKAFVERYERTVRAVKQLVQRGEECKRAIVRVLSKSQFLQLPESLYAHFALEPPRRPVVRSLGGG